MPVVFASPAASAAGTMRFMVTVLDAPRPGVPARVTVGGQPVAVSALRNWTSLRGASPAGVLSDGWSSLIEVPFPEGNVARAEVDVPGIPAPPFSLRLRSLPKEVPLPDESFNVMLVSCYCQETDLGGRVHTCAKHIHEQHRVDLTLLMGDQVYLDIPTAANLPAAEVPLADELERKYRANFVPKEGEPSFAALLGIAPNFAVADDHEYWNNAPHPSPFIENSWKKEGRDRWQKLADALFAGYQGFGPGASQDEPLRHAELVVEPLSFFLANTRSFREDSRARCMHPSTEAALRQWAAGLKAQRRIGVLLTGQSLLDSPASKFEGKVADYALPNYEDFPSLAQSVESALEGADVLLLTGDVHWGRVTKMVAQAAPEDERTVMEVISSPTSLVPNVATDWWSHLRNSMAGKKDAWPLHPAAPWVSGLVRWAGGSQVFKANTLYGHRGDMLCLLSFSRSGDAVSVAVRYFDVATRASSKPVQFNLKRR